MKKKYFIKILIAVLILMFIFIWGNSLLSADRSSLISEKIASILYNYLNPSVEFIEFHVFIRKSAHFIEYAFLGIFVMHILHLLKIHPIFSIILCLPICFGVACFDEWIQSFQPGRTYLLSDCLIDTKGSLFGIAIYCVVFLLYKMIHTTIKKIRRDCLDK